MMSLDDFKNQNVKGQSAKGHYLTTAKLEVIVEHYNVTFAKAKRAKTLEKLYTIPDFKERATRGYFPKNDGLPEAKKALRRPLDIADFKPIPNTMFKKVKQEGQKGSGRHSTWRNQFT